jgi:hypothetical protein
MELSVQEKIQKLTRQFYPTGRAFALPFDSYIFRLHRALSISQGQAYEDSIAILYSLLPDNDKFTSDDATDWERRLAITTNLSLPLETRKAEIRRKMAAPGIQPAHGHYLYLQRQLHAAGFNNVYVYESFFATYPSGWDYTNPADLNGAILSEVQQGQFQQGDWQQGFYINELVGNNTDNNKDIRFDPGGMNAVFFISAGPNTPGVYTNVSLSREAEFRRIVLKFKQLQTVGVMFLNFV